MNPMPAAERRSDPDRRTDTRRTNDWRLAQLENAVNALTAEAAAFRAMLGEGFTNIVAHLDKRYMPREELEREYIPRAEHERRRYRDLQTRLQVPMVLTSIGGWAIALVELLQRHH